MLFGLSAPPLEVADDGLMLPLLQELHLKLERGFGTEHSAHPHHSTLAERVAEVMSTRALHVPFALDIPRLRLLTLPHCMKSHMPIPNRSALYAEVLYQQCKCCPHGDNCSESASDTKVRRNAELLVCSLFHNFNVLE